MGYKTTTKAEDRRKMSRTMTSTRATSSLALPPTITTIYRPPTTTAASTAVQENEKEPEIRVKLRILSASEVVTKVKQVELVLFFTHPTEESSGAQQYTEEERNAALALVEMKNGTMGAVEATYQEDSGGDSPRIDNVTVEPSRMDILADPAARFEQEEMPTAALEAAKTATDAATISKGKLLSECSENIVLDNGFNAALVLSELKIDEMGTLKEKLQVASGGDSPRIQAVRPASGGLTQLYAVKEMQASVTVDLQTIINVPVAAAAVPAVAGEEPWVAEFPDSPVLENALSLDTGSSASIMGDEMCQETEDIEDLPLCDAAVVRSDIDAGKKKTRGVSSLFGSCFKSSAGTVHGADELVVKVETEKKENKKKEGKKSHAAAVNRIFTSKNSSSKSAKVPADNSEADVSSAYKSEKASGGGSALKRGAHKCNKRVKKCFTNMAAVCSSAAKKLF